MLFTLSLHSQGSFPKNYFGSPLEVPLYLAGNFGEFRSNHFHSGLDIKTQGREGLNVLASASGYVSRIKVSPYGYGRAIYVRHPNGFTTVYGHLKRFNWEIEQYVISQQYRYKSFTVELFPPASMFPLSRGDVIGISGNSGSSVAPHLHFEIRENAGEIPVNPLLFGFEISDRQKPTLSKLYLYPVNSESEINGKPDRSAFSLKANDGNYTVAGDLNINCHGKIGLGLDLYDLLDDVANHCGVYEIEIFDGGEPVYRFTIDKFPFHHSRYINAVIDYDEHLRNEKWILRGFVLPNNKLANCYPGKLNGILTLNEGDFKQIRVKVSDAYGNASELSVDLAGTGPSKPGNDVPEQRAAKYFKCDRSNSFESENIMIYLPANVLYEDLEFKFRTEDTIRGALAPLYHIHNLYTPLHSYIALSIRLKNVPASIRKYCLIASLDQEGNTIPEGGYWKGDFIIVKTRSFGPYTVVIDSTPPGLSPVNISPNADMSRKSSIIVKAEDNLSGVNEYNAYIDGKWTLMEFDYKAKRLIHNFEEGPSGGKHRFKLEVADKIGNRSVYETDFIR